MRRGWFIPSLVGGVLSILLLRAFDLQIVQGKELKDVAEQNRVFRRRVIANRGVIFDRLGKQLVFNKPIFYLLHNPKQLYTQRDIISEDQALEQLTASPSSIFSEQYREYLYPEALSQLTGYVAPVTKEDLDNSDHFHLHQSIGKVGLEAVYEDKLAGHDGEVVYETNAKGEIIREVSQRPPISGEHLYTSVDGELTNYIFSLMKDKKGAVLVGDSLTGEVLSLVSTPTFNANVFTKPSLNEAEELGKKQQLASFFQNEDKLFFNRSLAGGYPPGSVFKLVTALGGLETGVFDEETTVLDEGVLKVGDFEYGNWYFSQYGRTEGTIGLVKAISRSNDIFFYKAAEWLGPDKLAEIARLVGFGKKTGIELPAEASGIVPDPSWKEKTIGEKWFLGNTYHFGIGQGDLLVTPAQVFQSLTVFANSGKVCTPTLIKGKTSNCQNLSVSQESLDLIRQGMEGACSAGGTAFPFFPWNQTKENKVYCKTGTAEFGAADGRGHRKTHGWFVAFSDLQTQDEPETEGETVEKDKYPKRIMVVVLVESDATQPFREGSKDAAPIALSIMNWIEEFR